MNGKLVYSLLLTIVPFYFSNHNSMTYGCPNVQLVSILTWFQRTLDVLLYDENELPQNTFQMCVTGKSQKSNFLFGQILLEVKLVSRRDYQH